MTSLLALLLLACTPEAVRDLDPLLQTPEGPAGPALEDVGVIDIGLSSGYQDSWFGNFKRGRGNLVTDWDGDGDLDVFSGNPGNQSFLIRNTTVPGGPIQFEPWQVLSEDELFYGGVAADFDNDGDPDLAISAGANDGPEFDRYWRNDRDLGAPGDAPLVDLSFEMLLFPTLPDGTPFANGTMGMRAFDANNDGLLDLWASNEVRNFEELLGLTPDDVIGLNQLYIQTPEHALVDQAVALGIDQQAGSRHAAIFDFDNDGDQDIYDNAFTGRSVFWQNQLAQTGELAFVDVTDRAPLDGGDLAKPYTMQSMCSLAVDLDNDGWEDLLLLHRGIDAPFPEGAVQGHGVWMNVQGKGFVDVASYTGINEGWAEHPEQEVDGTMAWWGVMGCQVGDLNLDGFPDIFLGNGGGGAGEVDRLFVSHSRMHVEIEGHLVAVPLFDDWTELIDFPPPTPAGEVPRAYPLRTHGTAFVDFDRDGVSELSVHNGGPATRDMEEPNRLFQFDLPDPRFLRIAVRGDGVSVNRDGVGTRVRVRVERDRDGASWDLWRTRRAGEGFGAQNEPELVFGLGDGDRVVEIEVLWPDGTVRDVPPPVGARNWIHVDR